MRTPICPLFTPTFLSLFFFPSESLLFPFFLPGNFPFPPPIWPPLFCSFHLLVEVGPRPLFPPIRELVSFVCLTLPFSFSFRKLQSFPPPRHPKPTSVVLSSFGQCCSFCPYPPLYTLGLRLYFLFFLICDTPLASSGHPPCPPLFVCLEVYFRGLTLFVSLYLLRVGPDIPPLPPPHNKIPPFYLHVPSPCRLNDYPPPLPTFLFSPPCREKTCPPFSNPRRAAVLSNLGRFGSLQSKTFAVSTPRHSPSLRVTLSKKSLHCHSIPQTRRCQTYLTGTPPPFAPRRCFFFFCKYPAPPPPLQNHLLGHLAWFPSATPPFRRGHPLPPYLPPAKPVSFETVPLVTPFFLFSSFFVKLIFTSPCPPFHHGCHSHWNGVSSNGPFSPPTLPPPLVRPSLFSPLPHPPILPKRNFPGLYSFLVTPHPFHIVPQIFFLVELSDDGPQAARIFLKHRTLFFFPYLPHFFSKTCQQSLDNTVSHRIH